MPVPTQVYEICWRGTFLHGKLLQKPIPCTVLVAEARLVLQYDCFHTDQEKLNKVQELLPFYDRGELTYIDWSANAKPWSASRTQVAAYNNAVDTLTWCCHFASGSIPGQSQHLFPMAM